MEHKKGSLSGLMALCCLLLLTGCVGLGNYGMIRVASGERDATPQELLERWEDYNIFYAGLSVKSPSAILFDPKADGKRIVADKWVPVTERSVAETVVKWLDADVNFPPTLYQMLGPEGAFFGYIYTSSMQQVVIRELDPETLFVENLPLPPFDYGPGFR